MKSVIRKSKNMAIRQHIEKEVTKNGIIWSFFSLIMFYGIIGYYLYLTPNVEVLAVRCLFFGIMTATLGVCLFMSKHRQVKDVNNKYFKLSAFLLGVGWSVLGVTIITAWGKQDSAEKVIIIGFMISIVGFCVEKAMMVLASVPIVLTYFVIAILEAESTPIDIAISVIKFPILLGSFVFTIGRLVSRTQDAFGENQQMINFLEKNSLIDELTQIKNRKGFNCAIECTTSGSRRYGVPLPMVIIDIDYFKQYNDALGHPQGDECLKKVANVFKEHAKRGTDSVARIGGEEFALILPGLTLEKAEKFCYSIRSSLHDKNIPHPSSPTSDRITVSMGIAMHNGKDSESEFFEKADAAMYQSKNRGRNSITVSIEA